MNPQIENEKESDNNILTFTLSGVNVSLANAIRRTILSEIEIVVCKTSPYEENKMNISKNTSRLNNEILKQRLSCIPIYISDPDIQIKDYLLEVDVENLTDTIMFVTTEDFKIKNIITGEFLKKVDNDKIFPPNSFTGYYIDFARLRPKISDDIPGERLQFTCEFSYSTAKEDAMFNVTSICSYGMTVDVINMELELNKKIQSWRNDGLSPETIKFESENWKLLDGKRIVIKDSFDFIIQTLGVFMNQELIQKACIIIIKKLQNLNNLIDVNELVIVPSENIMNNCFDIILENEDYTIGKILEYILFSKYYENIKTMTYCGFVKLHPHDSDSIIRIAYKELTEKIVIFQNLKECIKDLVQVYQTIFDKFN